MSEAEKKRRAEYQKQRKRKILIQAIVILIVSLLIIASSVVYLQLSKTYYITYTESSHVDYRVYLNDNDFYTDEYLGPDQTYITNLIKHIEADINYRLDMNADNVKYEYSYSVIAQLQIKDKNTGNAIYVTDREIVPAKSFVKNGGSTLKISEKVQVDYPEFDRLAREFVSVYKLEDSAHANLALTLKVNVNSECEEFESDSSNTYSTTLNLPLAVQTMSAEVHSSAPDGESHVLACPNAINANIFKVLAIVLAVADVILIGVLVAFVYLTRNEDINYTIKVRKLLSNYKSYIQQINNEFDREGYQILNVNTFAEMLDIRDTIQSPILMYENEDKTRTEFLIPTNTKILYMFEIKVEDYDAIYAKAIAEEEMVYETEDSSDVVLEEIDYVDEIDEEVEDGVEVIGVVWPEKAHKNKIYRYDPDGETLYDGDVVLVPSRDKHSNKEIVRKAAVAHGNHRVDPEMLKHPLKKIISVVKRKHE